MGCCLNNLSRTDEDQNELCNYRSTDSFSDRVSYTGSSEVNNQVE